MTNTDRLAQALRDVPNRLRMIADDLDTADEATVQTELRKLADEYTALASLAPAADVVRRAQDAYEDATGFADYRNGEKGMRLALAAAFPALTAQVAALAAQCQGLRKDAGDNHKLDTDTRVFFYEQDFYVLSNFSSFRLKWRGHDFDTSEHAYHWAKFHGYDDAVNAGGSIAAQIMRARSAHEAFKIAEGCKFRRRPDWDAVKVDVMREILRAKADQHEYVRRKLLATGTRQLIEDSWRDDYWGWGPNRDGQNMLGKLWMEVRSAIAAGNGEGV